MQNSDLDLFVHSEFIYRRYPLIALSMRLSVFMWAVWYLQSKTIRPADLTAVWYREDAAVEDTPADTCNWVVTSGSTPQHLLTAVPKGTQHLLD